MARVTDIFTRTRGGLARAGRARTALGKDVARRTPGRV